MTASAFIQSYYLRMHALLKSRKETTVTFSTLTQIPLVIYRNSENFTSITWSNTVFSCRVQVKRLFLPRGALLSSLVVVACQSQSGDLYSLSPASLAPGGDLLLSLSLLPWLALFTCKLGSCRPQLSSKHFILGLRGPTDYTSILWSSRPMFHCASSVAKSALTFGYFNLLCITVKMLTKMQVKTETTYTSILQQLPIHNKSI